MVGEENIWINLSAIAALLGITAYALLGGADFGGGVWDLLASGPRKQAQRLAIQKAMGPVWEANHVWLILVIVILFTCFPAGYSAMVIAFFVPLHLALLGIMLRGASFVFRSHQGHSDGTSQASAWGVVFGTASIISPLLLGATFGVVTKGEVLVGETIQGTLGSAATWLSPYCICNGLLALSTCAFLAAVYLTNETKDELRDDFRRRAIWAGTTTAALAGITVFIGWHEAPWFMRQLLGSWRLPIVLAGLACFAGSAWSVFTRRARLSRVFAIGQIALLLLGWGCAQYPYLVYPHISLAESAAPLATLRFLVLSLPIGGAMIAPSLWLLLRVFKTR
ncbi:MAG: cytochrome d ubiquinol oxidase subunit II [Pirellulales bacterium]